MVQTIALCNQRIRFQRNKVRVRAHRTGNLLYIIAETDIRNYLKANGGSYTINIINADNTPLETDAEGNYIVIPGQQYKFTLGLSSPNGIVPGIYVYTLPQGLTVNAGEGDFVVDGVCIGSWTVDADGKIEMVLNQNSNNYTHVTISALMGITFSEEFSPLDFDGIISVIVKKKRTGY